MAKRKIYIEENPIRKYVSHLVHSGKTTIEKLCVVTDTLYPTFINLFKRETVSKLLMRSLEDSGVITRKLVDEYHAWEIEVYGGNRTLQKLDKKRRAKIKRYQKEPEAKLLIEEPGDADSAESGERVNEFEEFGEGDADELQ